MERELHPRGASAMIIKSIAADPEKQRNYEGFP